MPRLLTFVLTTLIASKRYSLSSALGCNNTLNSSSQQRSFIGGLISDVLLGVLSELVSAKNFMLFVGVRVHFPQLAKQHIAGHAVYLQALNKGS